MSKLIRSVPPLACALALAALAAPLQAGPPWVSVEYPVNPHDRLTRGALAVVHSYHHGDAKRVAVTASAVGLVNGARTEVRLRAVPTSRTGVYAVRGDLPAGESWVLVVTTRDDGHGGGSAATALVALGASGELLGVRVPYDVHEGRWHVPRAVTDADVDALLRTAVAMSAAGRAVTTQVGEAAAAPPSRAPLAALALVLLAPGAVLLRRRTRGS